MTEGYCELLKKKKDISTFMKINHNLSKVRKFSQTYAFIIQIYMYNCQLHCLVEKDLPRAIGPNNTNSCDQLSVLTKPISFSIASWIIHRRINLGLLHRTKSKQMVSFSTKTATAWRIRPRLRNAAKLTLTERNHEISRKKFASRAQRIHVAQEVTYQMSS